VSAVPPQIAAQQAGPSIPALESLGGDALLRALRTSARPGERPEELLFDLKLLRDRDFALELAFSSRRPFVGLRDFVPDERLFLYVPVTVAVANRVCPLVLIGDSLKLASAFLDPDLSYLESRFPHLDLEVVLAPRDEILHSLNLVAPA
jgi:hypothetical protein